MTNSDEDTPSTTEGRPVLEAVPTSESDRYRLVFDRPRFWEQGLYGAAMIDQLGVYEAHWRDYVIGYVSKIGPQVRIEDLADFLLERQSHFMKTVTNLNGVLDGGAQDRAFGEPGSPGDPVLIEHLARRLIDSYGSMISWVEGVRGARVDESAERAVEILSTFADQPIQAVRSFVLEFEARMNAVLDELRADPHPVNPIVIDITLTLTLPDSLVNEFSLELDALRRAIG